MERSDRVGIGLVIKSIRLRRKLTQRELAKASGLSESALRSYELGDRAPKDAHLEAIARALRVRPEAFKAGVIGNRLEAIHALFAIEDFYDLKPTMTDLGPALIATFRGPAMLKTLSDWAEMREKLDAGKITKEEYKDWKDAYDPSSPVDLSQPDGIGFDPYTGKKG